MLRKLWIGCLLAVSAADAAFYVRIAPPPIVVERPPPTPGPGYMWTPGYYTWNGAAYVWVPGAWVIAPWPEANVVQGTSRCRRRFDGSIKKGAFPVKHAVRTHNCRLNLLFPASGVVGDCRNRRAGPLRSYSMQLRTARVSVQITTDTAQWLSATPCQDVLWC
jgi:hypothetical protein